MTMASPQSPLDEILADLGLTRFHAPEPKPGGLVHLFQIVEERAKARLAGLSDAYAAPDGIDFGFAEHREFNAFAERTSRDIICLYAATVRTTWSLCNAVMGIRDIFPWIDDIDRLGENPLPPTKGELFYIQQGGAASETLQPIRRKLAMALFETAMDFALMHEVGHLWNGHVNWLHQRQGPRPFRELGLFDEKSDLNVAGALEFDADSFAIQKIFARAYRDNPFAEFAPGLLKDHKVPLDEPYTASWFFSWFAIYVLFRAFDEACAVSGISTRPHAPAPLRQASLLSTVVAVCRRQGWSNLDMNQWAALASDAGLEAEGAFCRLRRTSLDTGAFVAAWEGPALDLVESHVRTWERLGAELAPFKRGAMDPRSSAPPA
jgi:hypothetical protein